MIYSIGYGNRPFELFSNLLIRYEVHLLVDVRSHPYSRHNPNYNKTALTAHLPVIGIDYHFLGGALGGRPDDLKLYTCGIVDYAKIAASVEFLDGIQRVVDLALAFSNIALMCSELRPENCHRSRVLAPALLARSQTVLHIAETGQLLSQTQVTQRCNSPSQSPLI